MGPSLPRRRANSSHILPVTGSIAVPAKRAASAVALGEGGGGSRRWSKRNSAAYAYRFAVMGVVTAAYAYCAVIIVGMTTGGCCTDGCCVDGQMETWSVWVCYCVCWDYRWGGETTINLGGSVATGALRTLNVVMDTSSTMLIVSSVECRTRLHIPTTILRLSGAVMGRGVITLGSQASWRWWVATTLEQ